MRFLVIGIKVNDLIIKLLKKMKKILCLAAVAMFCLSAHSQVNWQKIELAGQTSLDGNTKMFLVDFSTSWCGWCKRMDKETFSRPEVWKIMNRYFIPVHFDAESKAPFKWNGKEFVNSGKKGPHDYTKAVLGSQIGYPSIAIFNEKMQLVQVQPGYMTPDEMVRFLCFFVNDNYKKYSYEKFVEYFDSNIYPEIKRELESE